MKLVFRRILNKLYANALIARREQLGAEMVKLLFAKIEDEVTFPERPPDFRVQAGEPPEQVRDRVANLFSRAAEALQGDGIFGQNEEIMLDPPSVAEVVGQLERGSLTQTDADVVGDAFEVFAESRLAGERGQFFTPRGVVKVAVKLADPKPGQTLCDPACGSGGFLIHAMRYIWQEMQSDRSGRWGSGAHLDAHKRRIAATTIFGTDKELDLVKIAKAYMAIAGDGRSNVQRGDSLAAESEHLAKQYDVVLTNPPFGTKSKVPVSQSRRFDLGHSWKSENGTWVKTKARKTDPYLLFIERCLDITKDKGVLAIVLPESVFHAPKLAYVRHYLREQGSIEAIVDLPHNSFRPHCNAKTCLLVLRKGASQSRVVMATPQEMGHDLQGKPLDNPETGQPWDDLAVVLQEIDQPEHPDNRFTFVVAPEAVLDDECWVPTYHRGLTYPTTMPSGCDSVSLGELVDGGSIESFDGHGSPRAVEKGRGTVPYIRVKDIVNWELYHNPVSGVPESEWKRLKADKRPPQVNDVILVRRGSYRIGTVAIVGPRDVKAILTRELMTLRVREPNPFGITPFYLLAMLSTPEVQNQIPAKVCLDTTLPNLGDRWRSIEIPIYEGKRLQEISDAAKAIIQQRRQAWRQTSNLAGVVGTLTT